MLELGWIPLASNRLGSKPQVRVKSALCHSFGAPGWRSNGSLGYCLLMEDGRNARQGGQRHNACLGLFLVLACYHAYCIPLVKASHVSKPKAKRMRISTPSGSVGKKHEHCLIVGSMGGCGVQRSLHHEKSNISPAFISAPG